LHYNESESESVATPQKEMWIFVYFIQRRQNERVSRVHHYFPGLQTFNSFFQRLRCTLLIYNWNEFTTITYWLIAYVNILKLSSHVIMYSV